MAFELVKVWPLLKHWTDSLAMPPNPQDQMSMSSTWFIMNQGWVTYISVTHRRSTTNFSKQRTTSMTLSQHDQYPTMTPMKLSQDRARQTLLSPEWPQIKHTSQTSPPLWVTNSSPSHQSIHRPVVKQCACPKWATPVVAHLLGKSLSCFNWPWLNAANAVKPGQWKTHQLERKVARRGCDETCRWRWQHRHASHRPCPQSSSWLQRSFQGRGQSSASSTYSSSSSSSPAHSLATPEKHLMFDVCI